MIEQLLREIKNGGTLQPATLAARLNVSTGLVDMMLEELEKRGLITQYQAECSASCNKCGLASSCSSANREKGRIWMLK